MECERAMSMAVPYLAGRMDEPLRSDLAAHFGSCLNCARSLRSLRTFRATVRASFPEEEKAPPELKASISVCIRCMEDPARTVCPRLRHRLRLASSLRNALT